MHSQTRNISDQLFQIKVLKDRLHKFETGEKYIRMQDEHKKALACEIRRCQRLEKELVDAHAAIVDVRNLVNFFGLPSVKSGFCQAI